MTATRCEMVTNDVNLTGREFRYSAQYRITTDDRAMSAFDVLNGATLMGPHPFPAYFATYLIFGRADINAFMQEATCKPLSDKEATTWMATANWFPISNTEETDDHTSIQDPLLRPVIYSREWEEISIPVEEGWNEVALPGITRAVDTFGPIQNAAGQEPSTPIMKTKRIPVIVAQKNYATLAEIDLLEQTYGDSLNDDAFAGYAAGECLFRGVNVSKPKFEGGKIFYTGTVRIACQRGGWSYQMVNRGWKKLVGGVLREATVSDANGDQVPVAEPVNLELNGTQTPDGQIGTVIGYRHRPLVDFSTMGI